MRAVFLGTPAIAVPSLLALREVAEVVGVVCQPDRPAGRGLSLTPPAVKVSAEGLGLHVYQPEKVRTGELEAWIRERDPELALVIAYGRILPKGVLDAPRRGCLNLHASLLPKYRGAAPIQWAIANGETKTGVSLMQMDEGLDTGPIYGSLELDIGAEETTGELFDRVAALAAEVVRTMIPGFVRGELSATPQLEALSTHAPPIETDATWLDFERPAKTIHDWVRALAPRPSARTLHAGKMLKILATKLDSGPALSPGEIAIQKPGRVWVGTQDQSLLILRAQLEGRRAVEAAEIVNGRLLADGDRLGGKR